MSAQELEVYEVFKSRFSELEAAKVIAYFKAKSEKKFEEKKDVLAPKENLLNVQGLLQKDLSEVKADIIKWMFIFWTGSVITILGGLFAFLKLFLDHA